MILRQSQSDESGYETTCRRMVRCGSIYDNYNCDTSTLFDPLPEEDEADEENSVVLHIDDDDTIENDIQGTGF